MAYVVVQGLCKIFKGGDTSKMESSRKKRGMQGYCSPPYKGGAGGESGESGESAGSADWSSSVMSRVTVEKSDLEFATLIYDAVIYWQDYFFGRMLQDSWENAERDIKPRVRNTFNSFAYNNLPKQFTLKDVEEEAKISYGAAGKQAQRWVAAGFAKRMKVGVYQKIKNTI